VSGVAAKRPERVLDKLEAGDVVVVTKPDRLVHSTRDLLRIIDRMARKAPASIRSATRGQTPRLHMAA
jgi:DNA invertase Pin-like site-specific DNA recombinase